MKASELLIKAAEYISEHGHVKCKLEDEDGRVCAGGAMRRVLGLSNIPPYLANLDLALPSREQRALIEEAAMALKPFTREEHWGNMVCWNNDERTSAEDVILGFKQAGYNLAEEGR